MTREKVKDEILQIDSPNILCELPTSFGKTRIALELVKSKFPDNEIGKILIVVPRLVLIDTWNAEFSKWGMGKYLSNVEFVTYVSLLKKAGSWDMVIFDEVHHLSERCREGLGGFKMKYCIMLSATVGYNLKKDLLGLFPDIFVYRVSTKQAIDDNILPDPKVYLIPLVLDNIHPTCEIVRNNSQRIELRVPFSQYRRYSKVKNRRIVITCTPQEYYNEISSWIEWYKKKSMCNGVFKTRFLRESGKRLKWLSEQKTKYVKHLLSLLTNERTLTFCNGISQTEELGKYCINSKNKTSKTHLTRFNEGKIDHITACNMLDEGVNLTNCRVGVYAILNSSERMITQKLGRLLRHPDPVIIIPYYKNTRDEELVNKMLADYNPNLVKTITKLTELKL